MSIAWQGWSMEEKCRPSKQIQLYYEPEWTAVACYTLLLTYCQILFHSGSEIEFGKKIIFDCSKLVQRSISEFAVAATIECIKQWFVFESVDKVKFMRCICLYVVKSRMLVVTIAVNFICAICNRLKYRIFI